MFCDLCGVCARKSYAREGQEQREMTNRGLKENLHKPMLQLVA